MNNKFIRQITRKLKCSGAKKKEIRMQLTADLTAALENGEKEEDILKRMGSPKEIAEDFNSSFAPQEFKKYRREKWLKRLITLVIILLAVAALAYWYLPKAKSVESAGFEEAAIQTQAEHIIQLVSEDDTAALRAECDENMAAIMTDDFLADAKSHFGDDWGEFVSFGNNYVSVIEQMNKTIAVVQINTSYENASITYTLSFDTNMKLCGLYMK